MLDRAGDSNPVADFGAAGVELRARQTFDRGFIDMLKRNDAAAIQALPRDKLNSGSSEIRNWICLAGAVEHLSLEWSLYEPGYRTPAGTGTGLGFAFWS